MTFQGTPPGFRAGNMSPRTATLRPDIGLGKELVEAVRRERKKGAEPPAIAETLAVPVEVVERAMLAMRTAKPDRRRRSLNCTLEAAAFVDRERQPDEPTWKAFDRLLGELIELRQNAELLAVAMRGWTPDREMQTEEEADQTERRINAACARILEGADARRELGARP